MNWKWVLFAPCLLFVLNCANKTNVTPAQQDAMQIEAASFKTPKTTFEFWRVSAITGNINAMVDCYASFKQDEKRKELKKLDRNAFQQMKNATAETKFTPGEPYYQGDRATMEVNWTKGISGDSQVLQFILEKNEWKIIQ